jgi:hypothetical protein
MVECKKYKATIPERTCFTRHRTLHAVKNKKVGMARFGQMNMAHARYLGCQDCKIGLRIFKKGVKNGKRFQKIGS